MSAAATEGRLGRLRAWARQPGPPDPKPNAFQATPWLAAAYAAIFLALARSPLDRATWWLENLVALPVGLLLIFGRRWLPFGTLSYAMLFGFLALHAVGSHYTYSEVPYGVALERVFGIAGAGERNHFDRFVHLAFGLLLTWPLAELLRSWLWGRARLAVAIAVLCILSLSTLYELLEWGAAALFAPEIGLAFVGAQGDIWDAQKDVALALAGSLLVACSAFVSLGETGPARPR